MPLLITTAEIIVYVTISLLAFQQKHAKETIYVQSLDALKLEFSFQMKYILRDMW